MNRLSRPLSLLLFILSQLLVSNSTAQTVVVASKQFTESRLLAEIAALKLESDGFEVERKLGLGGSLLVFNALQTGAIDLYPDYTGTLAQNLLKYPKASPVELEQALSDISLKIIAPLGFNNSYAMAINRAKAEDMQLSRVSQLRDWPDLRVAVSLEFLNRNDGWQALSRHYQLPQKAAALEHALAYPALARDQIDLTDAYTTDGELNRYDLLLLQDDLEFFPQYQALYLGRSNLPADVRASLAPMTQALNQTNMRQLNARVSETGKSIKQVAREFLLQAGFLASTDAPAPATDSAGQKILANTVTHMKLTLTALLAACLIAIPLGLLAAHHKRTATAVIYFAGLLQTIPSLALLALMIPLFGLGEVTAIMALFLYSILPILRNTVTGVNTIDPLLLQVADGMGLTAGQRLIKIELPLALPTLLAGVKTAAIICIGTATLAAFVGAGGLGEPIITGLTLNNQQLILQGALPAAALAILTEFLFQWIEHSVMPVQLRQANW